MKTVVIKEKPLIVLAYSSYNSGNSKLEIYAGDLQKAKVGTIFAPAGDNCGRDVYAESLKVIYKDSKGVACLLETLCSNDSPDAEYWEKEPELIWFGWGTESNEPVNYLAGFDEDNEPIDPSEFDDYEGE